MFFFDAAFWWWMGGFMACFAWLKAMAWYYRRTKKLPELSDDKPVTYGLVQCVNCAAYDVEKETHEALWNWRCWKCKCGGYEPVKEGFQRTKEAFDYMRSRPDYQPN